MELPARQVYSPASSADTFRRYRTSTSELLMSAVWGWGTYSGVTTRPGVILWLGRRLGTNPHTPRENSRAQVLVGARPSGLARRGSRRHRNCCH